MYQERTSLAVFVVILAAGASIGGTDDTDHPLVSRYPGSTIASKEVQEYDEYKLGSGLDPKGNVTGPTLEGKVTRILYQKPKERSNLEIMRNYEAALAKAGMETIWSCANRDCGRLWRQFNAIKAMTGPDTRYLAAKIRRTTGEAYVAISLGLTYAQVDVVEMTTMDSDLVTVNAEMLAGGLRSEGHVSVYGIYFDTAKSEVKPESKAALQEIAKMLRQEPSLNVRIVGHTDSDGGFEMNMELSRARAAAVVAALVGEHGVAASRLEAHGVGPLAPVAPNTTPEGKSKNRRVEIVAR
jgi:outer membrane protein OmpA-like peptidoglycan-associated protein